MATFQINNGVFTPSSVLKPNGGVVTVFPNNAGATIYFWHQKEDGTWHSSSTLFTNGQSNSGSLNSNQKAVLGIIQGAASGTYALTTSNQPPADVLTARQAEAQQDQGHSHDDLDEPQAWEE